VDYLNMGKSNFPDSDPRIRYIKMKGRKVYEYAMKYVPAAMKDCLDKAGVGISELKKVFIHQDCIPAISSYKRFSSESEALLIGNKVVNKIKQGHKPAITQQEINDAHIHY